MSAAGSGSSILRLRRKMLLLFWEEEFKNSLFRFNEFLREAELQEPVGKAKGFPTKRTNPPINSILTSDRLLIWRRESAGCFEPVSDVGHNPVDAAVRDVKNQLWQQ